MSKYIYDIKEVGVKTKRDSFGSEKEGKYGRMPARYVINLEAEDTVLNEWYYDDLKLAKQKYEFEKELMDPGCYILLFDCKTEAVLKDFYKPDEEDEELARYSEGSTEEEVSEDLDTLINKHTRKK